MLATTDQPARSVYGRTGAAVLGVGRAAAGAESGAAMDRPGVAILVAVLLSAVGVLGDYFLKLASNEKSIIWNKWFWIGFVVFSSTAFGWVYVMRHMKLATIGVVYAISMILLLTLTGVVFFKERLTYSEMGGIVLAVAAIVLLGRFAD